MLAEHFGTLNGGAPVQTGFRPASKSGSEGHQTVRLLWLSETGVQFLDSRGVV